MGNPTFTITVTGSNFTTGSVVVWSNGTANQNLATGIDTTSGGVITKLTNSGCLGYKSGCGAH